MKRIHKILAINPTYLPTNLPVEQCLFFDIETTGFNRVTCKIYLIGCIYYRNTQWHLEQWFLDAYENESAVLSAFFELSQSFSHLIHFNGDRFDLPFIDSRSQRCHINNPLSALASFDIYRQIVPYKDFLNLDTLKLKSIERFLGIYREDPFTGGELIHLYYDYLDTKSPELLQVLLLHNEEDLVGMIEIMPILTYANMAKTDNTLCLYRIFNHKLYLYLSYKDNFPKKIHNQLYDVHMYVKKNNILFVLPIYHGELKYYYPNYKDYYYLPAEDYAIHKSVGIYVDSTHRKKATKDTCYNKKESKFVPQFDKLITPHYQHSTIDKYSYFELTSDVLENHLKVSAYVLNLFNTFVKKRIN